jgi:hypothetical protein
LLARGLGNVSSPDYISREELVPYAVKAANDFDIMLEKAQKFYDEQARAPRRRACLAIGSEFFYATQWAALPSLIYINCSHPSCVFMSVHPPPCPSSPLSLVRVTFRHSSPIERVG